MDENNKNCEGSECNCNSSTSSIKGLLAFLGIMGLAYIGYKKRNDVDWAGLGDKACDIGQGLKDKTKNAIDKAKHHAQHFSRERREKIDELKDSLDTLFNKLDGRLSQLSDEKRTEYEHEVQELKQRFKRLIEK